MCEDRKKTARLIWRVESSLAADIPKTLEALKRGVVFIQQASGNGNHFFLLIKEREREVARVRIN